MKELFTLPLMPAKYLPLAITASQFKYGLSMIDSILGYDRPEAHECTMDLKGYCNGCEAIKEAVA
jgi:hypothetical protein